MREVLEDLIGWWQAGETVGMGTVVATWRSAPRPAGASMLVGPDGTAVGSVSGAGADGIAAWCSRPSSYVWKDAERWKIGWPCWTATTRRVVKERPSRMRSTV